MVESNCFLNLNLKYFWQLAMNRKNFGPLFFTELQQHWSISSNLIIVHSKTLGTFFYESLSDCITKAFLILRSELMPKDHPPGVFAKAQNSWIHQTQKVNQFLKQQTAPDHHTSTSILSYWNYVFLKKSFTTLAHFLIKVETNYLNLYFARKIWKTTFLPVFGAIYADSNTAVSLFFPRDE